MNKDVLPGVLFGLIGTVLMSVVMVVMKMAGLAPFHEPFPYLIIKTMFYPVTSVLILVILTVLALYVWLLLVGGFRGIFPTGPHHGRNRLRH